MILRILSMVFRLGREGGNLRYKIVYYRTNYNGYDVANGDILDAAILQFFQAKGPTHIDWEQVGLLAVINTQMAFDTFTPRRIPLVIAAHVNTTGMTLQELDALQQSRRNFPNQQKEVTLFHRANLNPGHENWPSLPPSMHVAIDYNIYQALAHTLTPY